MELKYKKLISKELNELENNLSNSVSSEIELATEVSSYLVNSGGKRIRPAICILVAKAFDYSGNDLIRLASSIELLHTATLIHDDVVDEAEKRRGFPAINRLWKNKIAVLMGDFILSKTLINMVGLKDFAALQLIADTAEKLAAGEILQIEKSLTGSMTEEVYFDMIYQKTASLISTSCELGAITSTGKNSDRHAMVKYGTKLGMAFQVKDDLFDLLGSEKQTGKDMGADVKRNMMTLPLIHTYEKSSRAQNRKVKRILKTKKKSWSDLKILKEIVHDSGGFKYAENKIDELNHQAFDAISEYPDSPYKQSLVDLLSFNAQRRG